MASVAAILLLAGTLLVSFLMALVAWCLSETRHLQRHTARLEAGLVQATACANSALLGHRQYNANIQHMAAEIAAVRVDLCTLTGQSGGTVSVPQGHA